MRDTIIKGAGNSRLLKSVPNALTIYPTHEALMQAVSTSGWPVDLLGLQAAGVEQMGTDLNKANLLSDAAETAIWGNAANRTPDAALKQLRSLIATAQNTANGRANIQVVSYVGTGVYAEIKTLTFSVVPKILMVFFENGHLSYMIPGVYTSGAAVCDYSTLGTEFDIETGLGFFDNSNRFYRSNKKSADGKTYSWRGVTDYESNQGQKDTAITWSFNVSGKKYTFIAIS